MRPLQRSDGGRAPLGYCDRNPHEHRVEVGWSLSGAVAADGSTAVDGRARRAALISGSLD